MSVRYANLHGESESLLESRADTLEAALLFSWQGFTRPVTASEVTPKQPLVLKSGRLVPFLLHEVMHEVDYLPRPTGEGHLLCLVNRID